MKKFYYSAIMAALLPVVSHADIYISEVVEGSSNNKAIEIANNGSSAVTLDGYKLASEYRNSWYNTYSLDGITIQPNDVWVIAHGSASNEVLAVADATYSSYMMQFNGDDGLALLYNDEAIDVVGDLFDMSYNKDVTLRRCEQTLSTVYTEWQWEVLAKDTFDNLGQYSEADASCVAPPAPTAPAEGEFTVASIMELQGTGSRSPVLEDGSYTSDQVYLVTGIVTAIQAGRLGNDLPTGYFIQDADGDGNPLSSDGIFVRGEVSALLNSGSDATQALAVGDEVQVYAKVTESYGWTQLIPEQSEGFDLTFATGNTGQITATPLRVLASDETIQDTYERYEGMLTRIDQESDIVIARTFGFDYGSFRNNMIAAHGGLLFQPTQKNAPGSEGAQAVVESNAQRQLYIESFAKAPNGVVPWYPEFGRDSGTGTSDSYLRIGATLDGFEGVLSYSYDAFRFFVTNEVDNSNFIYTHVPDRSASPEVDRGDLTIATMNVLNYFNSPFGGDDNPLNDNRGAEAFDEFQVQRSKIVAAILGLDADIVGLMEIENNGFDTDSAVVDLVSALNEQLPAAKQYAIAKPKDAKFVGSDAITSMVIYRKAKVGLEKIDILAMPRQAVPEEDYPVYFDGDYEDFRPTTKYMRDTLIPTFQINGPREKTLSVAVNHFKSKGSTCWEDLQGGYTDDNGRRIYKVEDADLQGNCEAFRTAAADYLGEQLKEYHGYRIIMGDLNAYATEDPLLVLTNRDNAPAGYSVKAGRNVKVGREELTGNGGEVIGHSYGYINIVPELHPDTISYSYNEIVGTLDHILISPDLHSYVKDAADWNINSAESTLFQYEGQYTGDLPKYADPFRSSDHDPAVLSLDIIDAIDSNVNAAVVGDLISLPATPVGMPSASTPQDGESYRAVMDLTQTGVNSLAVGDIVTLVVSDMNRNGVVTQSQVAHVQLTEQQIAQGWVAHSFKAPVVGDFVTETYYKDTQVSEQRSTVAEAGSYGETNGAGSSGPWLLLSLFGLLLFRRRNA
ncbi:ExeM/NucH family extracellular endonuclease [Agarivorans gilvus]|uniref:Nuclease n=1 Tax=Agarivorans gilvus TaxID=680279 RepID=A0ABQ1I608_9ALTE|nr:ExeM/NucH family extracellular endonuclease [Agarivorans gilvus]GGB19881.1 nuclease [Agarivorans gilvus]